MMGNGWALQGGTSHYLGTNFAKVFETTFLDRDNQRRFVHQSSWGVSTRLVGAVIMAHGDANGLRLPPRIAPVQAVIIPIGLQDPRAPEVMETADAMARDLSARGVRASVDGRDNMSPGFKFNHWEVRGVPCASSSGPRDLDAAQATLARRNGKEKFTLPLEGIADAVPALLDDIHTGMLEEAGRFRESHTF
ncbi:MAG: His/Gly/Thr/Pro-type tRNA ligase C-terminal domain-containing protein [Desulfomicrobium escambiense]|nr:His/Gly/Thr/Pro-type tRNA ligase C-terminal domain-containing protein [Desulfomicrobium escambiense]